MADNNGGSVQLIWGIALILAGLGVIYRLPQVWPKIMDISIFAAAPGVIRFCFYFMAVFLIGGGCKKVYHYLRNNSTPGKQ